jgi:hypothetical protein
MKFIFSLSFLSILFVSCKKDRACPGSVEGVMHNYAGLDGCGWVIEINGFIYEPININDFNGNFLVEGKEVNVSYEEKGMASICMVGPTILINCLSEN